MRLLPDLVYAGGRVQSGLAVEIAEGRITAVAAADTPDGLRLPGSLLLPGTVNAHCHSFQSLLRGLGDDLDFMAWRDRVLYPYSTRLDRDGIYLGAAFAFAEMLLHGATTCVDFFYLQDEGNDNAEAVIQAARDVGIRLVLARTLAEHGATPIRYLDALGVLGERMIGVHCVWLDDDEVRLMGARGAGLAYCPSSNMILGDGITRITELQAAGVRIGLGTDGGCTNNRLSVFEEMRMAALLQKVRHLDGTRVSAEEAFAMGTRGGAALLGIDAGDIAPGRLADLVAVDITHPSLHPRTNPLKSVVYAMSPQAITDVWVHGRRVVERQRLATLDQEALMERVRALTNDWRPA